MPNHQPIVADQRGRRFACSPAAVLVFLINDREELLLLAHPQRRGGWEVINGALEAAETLVDAVLRETREEVGPEVAIRPLGALHAATFRYDDTLQYMLSICYLAAYLGGEIEPGDDMAGSAARWWPVDELLRSDDRLLVPRDQKWLAARAIELYRLWNGQSPELQPAIASSAGQPSKYDP